MQEFSFKINKKKVIFENKLISYNIFIKLNLFIGYIINEKDKYSNS
jgi:hypothetical protein